MTPAGREYFIELGDGLRGQLDDIKSFRGTGISAEDTIASAGGDDSHISAPRERLSEKTEGNVQQLFLGLDPDGASLSEYRVVDGVGASESAGVGLNGTGGGIGLPGLEDDDRLFPGNLAHLFNEVPAVIDALDVGHDDLYGGVFAKVLDIVLNLDIGGTATAYIAVESDASLIPGGNDSATDVASLRDEAKGAISDYHGEHEGPQVCRSTPEAHAVGADEADFTSAGYIQDFILESLAFLTGLGEAGGDDTASPDSPGDAVLHDRGHSRGRDDKDGEIDRFRDIGDAGISLVAEDRISVVIDRIDLTDEAIEDAGEGRKPPLVPVIGGTDNGDGCRVEQGLQFPDYGGFAHSFFSPDVLLKADFSMSLFSFYH